MKLDQTIPFMRHPYEYISQEAKKRHSEVFVTRIMLQRTICLMGKEGAKLFYDSSLFQRQGAAPEPIKATLFGKGGVQNLDEEAHLQRKQMFMSFMTQDKINQLAQLTREWLEFYGDLWTIKKKAELYEQMQQVLTRAVCDWVGVPLMDTEVKERAKQLTALFDQAGAKGPGHLEARLLRKKSEAWISELIDLVRMGKFIPPTQSPLSLIANFRDSDGKLMTPKTAAVEILNILRPTVAVSLYVVFIAHALALHPECAEKIKARDEFYLHHFIQEVRRFYPFFPSTVARVKKSFEWKGVQFKKGDRVMLDLYGTNHDPREWDRPHLFNPDRFKNWDGSPYNFIPQGGGDHLTQHRCPGEWITIELMKVAADFLVNQLNYQLPPQDLTIDMTRLPAVPKSHIQMSNISMSKERRGIYPSRFTAKATWSSNELS